MPATKRPAHPRRAREAAGLTPVALAAAVPCSLALVYSCEAHGTYPKQQALRVAYLRALQPVKG